MDIYICIPVSGCVGRGSSALFCRGPIIILRRPYYSIQLYLQNWKVAISCLNCNPQAI